MMALGAGINPHRALKRGSGILPATAPISRPARPVDRRASGQQQQAVALSRGVGELAEQRRGRAAAEGSAPAKDAAAAPAANGANAVPEDDRPATLRNIMFVSSEVRRRSCVVGWGLPPDEPIMRKML